MTPAEAKAAILAYLASHGPVSYEDMLVAIPGLPADRVAHWLFTLRNQKKVNMAVTAMRGADGQWEYAHTVKASD